MTFRDILVRIRHVRYRLVELLRSYSNDFALKQTLDRLARKPRSRPVSDTVRPPATHKIRHRLDPEVIQNIISAYEAGNSTVTLMRLYQIGKGAVTRVLQNAGTEIRRQGLHNPEDQAEAIRLYAAGWSAARAGGKLGCSADTVLLLVRRAGQSVRPSVGGRYGRAI